MGWFYGNEYATFYVTFDQDVWLIESVDQPKPRSAVLPKNVVPVDHDVADPSVLNAAIQIEKKQQEEKTVRYRTSARKDIPATFDEIKDLRDILHSIVRTEKKLRQLKTKAKRLCLEQAEAQDLDVMADDFQELAVWAHDTAGIITRQDVRSTGRQVMDRLMDMLVDEGVDLHAVPDLQERLYRVERAVDQFNAVVGVAPLFRSLDPDAPASKSIQYRTRRRGSAGSCVNDPNAINALLTVMDEVEALLAMVQN